MKSYKVNEADAVFSESINITETTDTNHADNINAAPKEIFENTVALNREVKTIKKNMEEESGESIGYNNESKNTCSHYLFLSNRLCHRPSFNID